MTKNTQRQLRDGAMALEAPTDLSEMSKDNLCELREALVNGVLALQSLDDLGSDEANNAAYKDLQEIIRRLALVDEAITNITQELEYVPYEPYSPDTIRSIINNPNTKVVIAPTSAVDRLNDFIKPVIAAVEDVLGITLSLITEQSMVSDCFNSARDRSKDGQLYQQLGDKLHLVLDPGRNPDDRYIVKIAQRLKQKSMDLSESS